MPSSDRSGRMQMTHSSGCTSPTEFEDEGGEGEEDEEDEEDGEGEEGVERVESDEE